MSGRAEPLRRAIADRTATFGVIGQGYVGLPLAVAFAEAGFRAIGFDVSAATVAGLNGGHSHIPDVPDTALAPLVATDQYAATTDMTRLAEADVISICVPTPLGKTRDPDISYVATATAEVAAALRPGQLVILESTAYPGTTRRARFIELAGEINSGMPEWWVDKVWLALNAEGKSVKGSRVLVVGVAYKPDIDDVRESPALDIIALLAAGGAEVAYHDPHVACQNLSPSASRSPPTSSGEPGR